MQTMAFRPSPLPSPSPLAPQPPPGLPVSLPSPSLGVPANSNIGFLQTSNLGNLNGRSSRPLASPDGQGTDPVRASVAHLLSRAHGVPCSAAAQAFSQLVVQPARFNIALEILLPALSAQVEAPLRILVAYILYHLYAAHPIAMNPFKSAFVDVFIRERDTAAKFYGGRNDVGGDGVAERGPEADSSHSNDQLGQEQLVWVLWKILKGDGTDLGPYSPATLATSPLPPKLRASQLTIDDFLITTEDESQDHALTLETQNLSPAPQYLDRRILSPAFPATPSSRTPFGSRKASPMPIAFPDHAKRETVALGIRLLQEGTQRVLTLTEQRTVSLNLPYFNPQTCLSLESFPSLFSHNPALGHPIVVQILSSQHLQVGYHGFIGSGLASGGPESPITSAEPAANIVKVLRSLPPTLPAFDILGKLLRDPTIIPMPLEAPESGNTLSSRKGWYTTRPGTEKNITGLAVPFRTAKTTVADLIRTEVLGAFVQNAIDWISTTEQHMQEGLISDDRAEKAVQSLCRFYNSLIKLGLVDASSDTDSAAMAQFALSHAHFEDAHALYRVIVMGKF